MATLCAAFDRPEIILFIYQLISNVFDRIVAVFFSFNFLTPVSFLEVQIILPDFSVHARDTKQIVRQSHIQP